jgi:hypothetical protein
MTGIIHKLAILRIRLTARLQGDVIIITTRYHYCVAEENDAFICKTGNTIILMSVADKF